jgi:tetratricopeptide (TPR) repeat protein
MCGAVCWLALAAAVAPAQEERPAGLQFEQAQRTIVAADQAREAADATRAAELYQAALADYYRLARRYPDWEPGMTRFRINYCKEQLRGLMTGRSVAVAPAAPPSPPSAADSVHAARIAAGRLLAAGRPAEARPILIEALKLNPEDPATRLLLGLSRCQEGDFVDAMYVLESVVTDDPGNAPAHVALAAAYMGLRQTADAKTQLERALALDPRNADAHYNLARACLTDEQADTEAAERHYRRSLELGGRRDRDLEDTLSKPRAVKPSGWRRFVPFMPGRRTPTPTHLSTNAPSATR